MRLTWAWLFAPAASLAVAVACSRAPRETKADAAAPAAADAGEPIDASFDVDPDVLADVALGDPHEVDPMALHLETKEAILGLFEIKRPPARDSNADVFLDKSFGPGAPFRTNQGNKELAKHLISHAQCLKGLQGIDIQTDEQKAICGAPNMVPIFKKGDPKKTKACIDIFEFPNVACELPFVWIAPTQAKTVCELQGKRLCSEEEWILACKGDPEGGKDRKYAYGDELDLDVCNTNKPAHKFGPGCEPDSAKSAWKTCATNTEPSGSFPKCRSRFGVFDMHGNVAEIMVRFDPDENKLMDQLKGSAFFYVDVARDENGKPPPGKKKPTDPDAAKRWGRETYPDICAHDPRWHVEPMSSAWHVNYHLGFRCCKTVHPAKD